MLIEIMLETLITESENAVLNKFTNATTILQQNGNSDNSQEPMKSSSLTTKLRFQGRIFIVPTIILKHLSSSYISIAYDREIYPEDY